MKGKNMWPPKISMAKTALLRSWFSGASTSYTTGVISAQEEHMNYRDT